MQEYSELTAGKNSRPIKSTHSLLTNN